LPTRKKSNLKPEPTFGVSQANLEDFHCFPPTDMLSFQSTFVCGSTRSEGILTTTVDPPSIEHNIICSDDTAVDKQLVKDTGMHKQSKKQCRYCVYDGVFTHSGMDPVNKVGIWKKGTRQICVKKHSLKYQNNTGQFYICDMENMEMCHFYKPKE
jgi:hypothetical protein